MPRKLNTPLPLFWDCWARCLDQGLHFFYCSARKPCLGHFGHIQGQEHVGLFQLYPISLPCHSSRYVENLQGISCRVWKWHSATTSTIHVSAASSTENIVCFSHSWGCLWRNSCAKIPEQTTWWCLVSRSVRGKASVDHGGSLLRAAINWSRKSSTTLVSVRNTRVFRTALTALREPHTLWRRITCYPSPRRWVASHTYLLYCVVTYMHIRTTRVLHASQLCWSRLHNAWRCFSLSPAAASLGMLLVPLEIIATTYRSTIFKTYAFSLYSHLCIYATYLHTVYLDWQHAVIVSNSRCAWRWWSSERPPPLGLYLFTPAVAH